MANPTIGSIKCPLGDGCTGEVRQYARGKRKFYWVCEHGMITPNLPLGQKFIEERMKAIEGQPESEPAPAPVPEEKPKPKPKRKSFLAGLLEDDDE
jgi:hypothetical protein